MSHPVGHPLFRCLSFLWAFLALTPLSVLGGSSANESARQIPVAYQTDVVVVGGSTGAVAAAVAAAQAGAKVFLAAPHPYLGDDMTATLRLWLEQGERPSSPLGQQIFDDPNRNGSAPHPDRLPFSYRASISPAKNHKDTDPPSLLTDGAWGVSSKQSVQYDGNVEITADLQSVQEIREVRVVFYQRDSKAGGGTFKIDDIAVATSDDGKSWRDEVVMKNRPDNPLRVNLQSGDCFSLETPLQGRARYVKFLVAKTADTNRILLGEIEIIGPPRAASAKTSTLLPVRPLHVKQTLDSALLDAGVQFLYSCYATDVLRDAQGNPCGIVMANRAGRQAVVAKMIVDATDRALVARLAGGKFRPYPAGPHAFKRVVIGGEPCSGTGLAVRRIESGYSGVKSSTGYPIYEYTLTLPMADASIASWAEAEQQARSLTYHEEQQFTSDDLFEVPPDAMYGKVSANGEWKGAGSLPLDSLRPAGVDRLYVLGGCVDVSRAQAEKLVRPLALIDLGTRVGKAAADEARSLAAPMNPKLPATATAGPLLGEVREPLAGVRPAQKVPTIPAEPRSLPVLGQYDVVVVGGGTGGAPAGIAAGRQGAKTLVVEYLHNLGGVGTMGAISNYCAGNRVGFTATVQGDAVKNRSWRIEQKCQWWRSMLQEAKADVWFGVIGCGSVVENGRLAGVVVATPFGRGVVLARVVVDATGNADVAASAGSPCIYTGADEFGMQGTGLPPRQLGASYTNTDFAITDETDMVDVWHIYVYSKHKYPKAFDQGQLVDTRERRCIEGEYVLTVLDEVTCRTYPDTIVQAQGGSYDTHGYTVEPYLHFVHPRTSKVIVNIPFRCFLPKGLEGILVTGLGLSVHRDATPLVRMQPDVQNGGYAAGVAAAMAARSQTPVRNVDLKALQKHLVEIGNLTPSVLTDKDSHPLPRDVVAEAVKEIPQGDKAGDKAAVVFAQPADSLPLLRQAYASAQGDSKLSYAMALAMLQDRTGVDTIIDRVRQTPEWDKGWNYKGMGQFGNAMSPLDCRLVALGRAGDRRAVPVILEKLKLLSAQKEFSHHRAVGLAMELLHDPAAARPLAELLAQPGMSGYVHNTIATAVEREQPGGPNSEQTRRESLRELVLARALYRCGDYQGVGEKTLRAYTRDLRGHLARHAQAVLDAGKKP
jgi:hypothetical protein